MMYTPSPLLNPLATVEQLKASRSSLDGVPIGLEDSVRFETCRLVQTAGTLLRVHQSTIAQAIVLLCRFWLGPEGGSMLEHDGQVSLAEGAAIKIVSDIRLQDVAAAALYVAAKPSGQSIAPRLLLMAFAYLVAAGPKYDAGLDGTAAPVSWSLTEGQYEDRRAQLYATELRLLSVLGFNIHVALPYTVCINYMQTLDTLKSSHATMVAQQTFKHLNTALFSPQMLYLTYQPTALATAAIYLAAREAQVKLPETEWWEVFDVDREDLGFLVVALQSVEAFVEEESNRWHQNISLLTVADVKAAIDKASLG